MKTLTVYGTRYDEPTGNVEEIYRVIEEDRFDVRVMNAKKEKIRNISEYELVISDLYKIEFAGVITYLTSVESAGLE